MTWIALTTAITAVFAAITTLYGGEGNVPPPPLPPPTREGEQREGPL